ncbi:MULTISPECIES: hypothetical protein [unclassified Sphingomonas]|uniref:hypothetical protein n=1 Tax=unclassified Sphingomonas TaxID=196159 RepID=UPI0006F7B92F|nr:MULTISPECIES: hypothetical protein [unclassified Sphingomonas]KQM58792.1 hypothetical protein ASE65_10535 [Sphingomonas sp. Leaf16]KQN11047.1 hypothetical protein ASE81_11520 [Sphingomonas sp. Leaf29]KQN18348.1 hypothetical protein ASE83_11455 [Sphingomonas sp. Leaf32]
MIVDPASVGLTGGGVAFAPSVLAIGGAHLGLMSGAVALSTDYALAIYGLKDKKLNRLRASESMVTPQGQPTAQFQQSYQQNVEQIEGAIRALATGQIDLRNIVDILLATQRAAGAAQVAAEQAQSEVAAQKQANDTFTRVRDSYADPGAVTASTAGTSSTIAIAPHQRHYLDPIQDVPVTAGAIPWPTPGETVFVYYDDETLSGGAVAYVGTLAQAESVATLSNPYRHQVGSVTVPATSGGSSEGQPSYPPWYRQEREEVSTV